MKNLIRITLCSFLLGSIARTAMAMASPSISQQSLLRTLRLEQSLREKKRLSGAHATYQRLLKQNPYWKPRYEDMPEFREARMSSATVLRREMQRKQRDKEAVKKLREEALKAIQLKEHLELAKKYREETTSASSAEFREEE